jgi:hypothetical protein
MLAMVRKGGNGGGHTQGAAAYEIRQQNRRELLIIAGLRYTEGAPPKAVRAQERACNWTSTRSRNFYRIDTRFY